MWHVAWMEKLPRKIVGVEYYMLGAFRGKVATCWRRKVLFPRVRVGKGKLYFVKLGFWKLAAWSYLASSVIALHSLFLCHLGTHWMTVTQWQLWVCYVSQVLGSLRWTSGLDVWGQDEPSGKGDDPLRASPGCCLDSGAGSFVFTERPRGRHSVGTVLCLFLSFMWHAFRPMTI